MTDLLGAATVDWRLGAAYAVRNRATADFVDRAELYWWHGTLAGIRPEVAFLQHAHETGWGHFGGVLDASFHNCAGIKVARPGDAPWPDGMTPDPRGSDFNPNAHQRWGDWSAGVAGHYWHMRAYAFGRPGIDNTVVAHERFYLICGLSWAGTVRTVEDLDRWAGGPGSGYGPRLAQRLDDFLVWATL